MKRNFLSIAFLFLVLVSCTTSKEINLSGKKGHFGLKSQLDLQFSNHDNSGFELKQYDGSWDVQTQTICLSGILVRDKNQTMEQLTVCIEGVNLNEIEYPYVLDSESKNHALIGWYNEEEVLREKLLCGDSENCEYQGSLKKDNISLVLTGFKNNILEGMFSGRLYLKGTGNIRFVKTSEYKDIHSGYFRMTLTNQSLASKELADNK